ncbi:MAG: hypothetical protein ACRCST_09930 [Turicibacter sp.]
MAKDNTSTETKVKTPKKKTKKADKQTIFYSVIGVLGVLTLLFGYSMLNYFYLQPSKASGKPVYGYRLENLPPVAETVITDVEKYALTQNNVQTASIDIKGPVIYIDLRVDLNTDLAVGRTSAENVASKLSDSVKVEGGKTLYDFYEVQLVVSNDDPKKLAEENSKAQEVYVQEFDLSVVEKVVVYAETYPTQANIDRANNNIVLLPEGRDRSALDARVKSLKALTAEEEEAIGEIPTLEVSKDVPRSTLAQYPAWGTSNSATKKIEWK